MYIKKLHIKAFGPITNTDLDFERGLNIIEGNNESGKTAVAMFIKFIFYGLSSRASDISISEKERYISWSVGEASGYAVCGFTENGKDKEIRIERILTGRKDTDGKSKYSERLRVVDNETSMPITINGQPGDFFFGVPENVFVSSAFASQEGGIKPGSDSLKEAIANIICAADENVNVKKAVDNIDKARKKLLHKNRTGGDIPELEQRRDALERHLAESVDTSTRLIKAELALSEVKSTIDSTIARNAELEGALNAITALSEDAKVKRISELKSTLSSLKAELDAESKENSHDSLITSLAVSIKDIERFDQQKAEVERLTEEVKNDVGSADRDPEEDHIEALLLSKKANHRFTIGTLLLIAGLIGIISSAALRLLNYPGFEIGLVLTSILIIIGIVLMVLSSKTRNRLYDILDYWDVDGEEELAQLSENVGGIYAELNSARLVLTSAEVNAEEAKKNVMKLAESYGIGTDGVSIQSLIKQLAIIGSDSIKKKKSLEANVARIEGQLSETVASLGNVSYDEITSKANEIRKTEIGAIVANMSESDAAAISRELQFNKSKIDNLNDRLIMLERECASLKAIPSSPATDAETLESLTAEIEKLKNTHEALVLAEETMAAAGDRIRLSVVPRLTAEASRIMSGMTDGKYSTLGFTSSFDMIFRDSDEGTLELDYLSAGTKDIAYISYRIALMKSLYGDTERPPIIFDESLSTLDKERASRAVKILENSGIQTLLFTCRSLEGELASGASRIVL